MKEKISLAKEKEKSLKYDKSLVKENEKFKKEIKVLKPMIDKFIFSSQKLQMILNNQKAIFNKTRISFNFLKK